MELKSVTPRPGNLKQHISKLGEKKYKCQECDYSTNWSSDLKNHSRHHTGEKYKCEKCNYSTASPSNMIKHKNVHNGKQFHCKKYDFSTNWRPSLKRQKHIHKLAKSKQDDDQELKNTKEIFLCKICDLTFLTNMNLKNHNMKHSTNDQHYSCHLCTFSAEQSVNLEAHLLVRHAL